MSNEQQRIPGVPIGWKITAIKRLEKKGEKYLDDCTVNTWSLDEPSCGQYPVLAPDNVYSCDLLAIPMVKGYERKGETIEEWFREPVIGEYYLSRYWFITRAAKDNEFSSSDTRRIVLQPIAPKTKRAVLNDQINADYAGRITELTRERDELAAHVEKLRETTEETVRDLWNSGKCNWLASRLDKALAVTPAASLAEHDAEVRRKVLEEAAAVLDAMQFSAPMSSWESAVTDGYKNGARKLRRMQEDK